MGSGRIASLQVTAASGDGGRLAELYRMHAGDAYRLAYLLTGDRELAADVTQEAFLRMVTRLRHLRKRESFSFYLRRATVNLVLSQRRRRLLERRYLEREAARDAVADIPDVATRLSLMQILRRLPPRQRTALVLRYYEDLSEEQAAQMLGVSPRAINSLVARGLDHIRRTGGMDEWDE